MATPKITNASEAAQSIAAVSATPDYSRPLIIVTTLFFMWGFLTSLNDILVPHLKSIFELSYARVMLIQFAFFSAYFLFSVPWSKVVNRIGYQSSMVVGLLTMAVGAFLFLPAASAASYPLFLSALVILAAGITGLQVAANPYVVVLGNPETASSRLDLTQAFNSLGTTIAPKLGGVADPERCAVRSRTVTATRATSSACVSRGASGLGQDAIHRDRRRPGVVGRVNRQFQAA
jgi:FHS family L-fucose permease-like MFS transporter